MGVGGFKAVGRPPAPLTTEGDSLPFPAGRGGGDGRASRTWAVVQRAGRRLPFFESRFSSLGEPLAVFVAWAVVLRLGAPSCPRLRGPR